ncbi:MAG TPA: hypothetical protein ENI69_01495 [Rhodospirillales bacterium]|nr:hypothetical protein [Rhodospirillales bacterium]
MFNALHPDRMTAAERLDEVAAILGAGILRIWQKHNEYNVLGDVSLDLSAPQSVHGHGTNDHGENP